MARDTKLGSDVPAALFPDLAVYNSDGTQTSAPADGDVLSYWLLCDICGTPFDEKWKKFKRDGQTVCRLCLDK